MNFWLTTMVSMDFAKKLVTAWQGKRVGLKLKGIYYTTLTKAHGMVLPSFPSVSDRVRSI